MNRADRSFRTMGCDADVRLESARLSQLELERAADGVRATFEQVNRGLSRFRPDSGLSRLNRDTRDAVPASALLRRFAAAVGWAGWRSDGLVDCTLLEHLTRQGYARSREGVMPAPLADALAVAPPRRAARPSGDRAYAAVGADAWRVFRPPGVTLDSGGLGKGLAVDLAAEGLPAGIRYAIACGGDLAVGGRPWWVAVRDARTGTEAHRLLCQPGGVATSGIESRIWRRPDGSYAHHVLDPSTGEPAWTGLVAVTALAASGLEAEVAAKAALLAGPRGARRMLYARGGVIQHDSGRIEVVPTLPSRRLRRGAIVRSAA